MQKGVAGSLIEQCVLEYDPDSKQEADLTVKDGNKSMKVELKTTGMVISDKPVEHYVAKEPMSITAVGVYDISEQTFDKSHFWEKLEHMLIVKQEYIETHGELRRLLNYVDLAPKFPPRFRLKKPIVSSIIAKHFGYELEQLPGRYSTISDIDRKCNLSLGGGLYILILYIRNNELKLHII